MTNREAGEMERELTMEQDASGTAFAGADASQGSEQEQLLHEIEETRADLGDTVDALSKKVDVRARLSEQVERGKAAWRKRQENAKQAASHVARTAEERPLPAIAIALGVGLLIGRTIGGR
jgi:ElaB/YqjD/DUF883 family membrane-anchored ribosome-binding protein